MHVNLTINRKLTLYIAVLILIIVTLAIASVVGLHIIDQKGETLERQTLVSTQILGELDAHVSRFRVAEEYRAAASDADTRSAAERSTANHRHQIEELQKRYQALQTDHDGAADLAAFNTAWDAYMVAHEAWVRLDTFGEFDESARYLDSLHSLYVAADQAARDVILADTLRGDLMAEAVDHAVHQTIFFIVVLSISAILVASLLLLRVTLDITRPLSAMTVALGALAKGDRHILVSSPNRHDEIGVMADAFNVFRANTFALEQAHEAARRAEDQAQALARHDPLTGLPNRRVFEAEIEQAVSKALLGEQVCSLLMIDLDRFKPINDQLGHPAGDFVLCTVADRLTTLLDEEVTAARLGGDEFALILSSAAAVHADKLRSLAETALSCLQEAIDIGSTSVAIGATIGIASAPADGRDRQTLLRAADLALYRAKREGRGRIFCFEPSLEIELKEKARLEADLRSAIASHAIVPRYRTVAVLESGSPCGFEMLPHWEHEVLGVMSPDSYMPLADQLGLRSDLLWPLLRQGCRDAASWPRAISLIVTLSQAQLRDPALPTQIMRILTRENLNPSRLEIQVPELALIDEVEPTEAILKALQSAGIKISIGDFGTGYSRMCRFDGLQFDAVKIDGSFSRSLFAGERSEGIVSTILALAKNLGRSAAADGVETPEVSAKLFSLGCQLGQGGLFGSTFAASEVSARALSRTN